MMPDWISAFWHAWLEGGFWIWPLALMASSIWALGLKTLWDMRFSQRDDFPPDFPGYRIRAIRVLSAAAPLLGLLGTVSAMTGIFTGLEAGGFAGDRAMAGGIAQALVSTQAGLLTAIPGVFLAHVLELRQRSEKGRMWE
ncbi:MotA/TolQ/ExbB proton channel family protein [Desulfobotulus sp. H1]|uniref:MotA/TolQ/ExbB proton channel family protein n=1 Tax=Desulfobotulus pelophilus TaxID=2823377 RepID=A0ABT3N4W1_9BACT|nr:MotA/TolQ/ExbB proton channel family protein [Desulfobotulus pelophilus]MCW7752500.1 MotA/TolQ/ExbB proton channel family protein [Desulfobotulus pelophilus]